MKLRIIAAILILVVIGSYVAVRTDVITGNTVLESSSPYSDYEVVIKERFASDDKFIEIRRDGIVGKIDLWENVKFVDDVSWNEEQVKISLNNAVYLIVYDLDSKEYTIHTYD